MGLFSRMWYERNGKVNYDDINFTENTRATYPLNFIEKVNIPAIYGHPNILYYYLLMLMDYYHQSLN